MSYIPWDMTHVSSETLFGALTAESVMRRNFVPRSTRILEHRRITTGELRNRNFRPVVRRVFFARHHHLVVLVLLGLDEDALKHAEVGFDGVH